MKYFTIIICLLGGTVGANAQELLAIRKVSRFICPSDSISYYFKKNYLKKSGIDTLLTLHYLYDNGRAEREMQAFLWKEKEGIKAKIIKGCDNVEVTGILPINEIDPFAQYFANHLEELEHTRYDAASHDFGYTFTMKQGAFEKSGYIRDYRRGEDNFRKKQKAELKEEAEKDPLIRWLNLIDRRIRKME